MQGRTWMTRSVCGSVFSSHSLSTPRVTSCWPLLLDTTSTSTLLDAAGSARSQSGGKVGDSPTDPGGRCSVELEDRGQAVAAGTGDWKSGPHELLAPACRTTVTTRWRWRAGDSHAPPPSLVSWPLAHGAGSGERHNQQGQQEPKLDVQLEVRWIVAWCDWQVREWLLAAPAVPSDVQGQAEVIAFQQERRLTKEGGEAVAVTAGEGADERLQVVDARRLPRQHAVKQPPWPEPRSESSSACHTFHALL